MSYQQWSLATTAWPTRNDDIANPLSFATSTIRSSAAKRYGSWWGGGSDPDVLNTRTAFIFKVNGCVFFCFFSLRKANKVLNLNIITRQLDHDDSTNTSLRNVAELLPSETPKLTLLQTVTDTKDSTGSYEINYFFTYYIPFVDNI